MCKELEVRIAKVNRTGGNGSLTDVFNSLSEHRISVSKAIEVVRNYLELGRMDDFEPSQGSDECEMTELELTRRITNYRAAMRRILNLSLAGENEKIQNACRRWHVNTPEEEDL